MSLLGLPLSTLLSIGGAAAAAIVVLYILKLRRRPVPVPYSPIWQRILRDKEATTLFSQLRRLLSLLLQLALIGALVFALGDPRMTAKLLEGRNLVVLVDGSASMKATDVAPSRSGVAQEEVRRMLRGLGASDRMLIAQMDAALTPLSTMTGEVVELEAAVNQLGATDTRADLRRGLGFALDSLRGLPKPEIVIVSDGVLGDAKSAAEGLDLQGVALHFVPVGKSGQNVAITNFSVRRYPLDKSRAEVMIELTNLSDGPAEIELRLLGDGELIETTRLLLHKGERLPRFYKDLAGANRTLEATLRLADGTSDDLPADDHAYALMPERRRARICVVTAGNTYLEAALLLDEYLDVTEVAPARYPPAGRFDVTIFDGVAPTPAEGGGASLYLAPPAEGGPLKVGKAIKAFGFDAWDKTSPLVRWMALGDVQVARGHALVPEKGDQVVGKSDLGPILVAGRRAGRRFVELGFDPRDSDLVLRVAWPLFVLNVIDTFVAEDTSYVSSYKTGDVWQLPAPSGVDTAVLRAPDGRSRSLPVKQGRAAYLGEQAGFYELTVPTQPEPTTTRFAANLADPLESQIAPATELELGAPVSGAPEFSTGVRREVWIYLLLGVIAVSLLEWFTYHKRWSV